LRATRFVDAFLLSDLSLLSLPLSFSSRTLASSGPES